MKKGLIVAGLVVTALIVAACGGAPGNDVAATQQEAPAASAPKQVPLNLETQSNDEGKVAVDVTPLSVDGEQWDFQVAFNTHSVNLAFDPAQISVLRCDRGEEFEPVSWNGAGPGGHHRSGTLTFAALDHPVSSVDLVIRGVAQVPERVFHWEVPDSTAPAGDSTQAGDASSAARADQGQGAPYLALDADVFDYGDVSMSAGKVVSRKIEITNTGGATLHIAEVEPT